MIEHTLMLWYLTGFVSLILGVYIASDDNWNILDLLTWSSFGPITLLAVICTLKEVIRELEADNIYLKGDE